MEQVAVEKDEGSDSEAEHEQQLGILALMQNNARARCLWLAGGLSALLFIAFTAGNACMPILTTLFCASCFAWLLLTRIVGLDLLEIWRDLTGPRERTEKKVEKKQEARPELSLAVGVACLILLGAMNDDSYVTIMLTVFLMTYLVIPYFLSLVIPAPWSTWIIREEATEKKDK